MLRLAAILFCAGLICADQAHAQTQSIPSLLVQNQKYIGPGDVLSGAVEYYGFRCYNYAYAGTVADLWDSGTGSTSETTITCNNGQLVYSGATGCTAGSGCAILSTTCASGCVVGAIYDQSGANGCSAAPCNLTQGTNSKRPTYTFSASHQGKNCATFLGSNSQSLGNATANSNQTGAFSAIFYSSRTATFTSFVAIWDYNNNGISSFYNNAVTQIVAGGATSVHSNVAGGGPSDGNQYPFQMLWNTTNAGAYISGQPATMNGSSTGSLVLTGARTDIGVNGSAASAYLTGVFCELGIWGNTTFSNGQIAAMNTNQNAFW